MHSFTVSAEFPTTPRSIYTAWLDGEQHAQMTGGDAVGIPEVGAKFTAWDGYIWGTNMELTPDQKVVQSWRTSDFEENDEDSRIEVTFEHSDIGCKVILHHTNIPEDHPSDYEQGWEDHYFAPMRLFFSA